MSEVHGQYRVYEFRTEYGELVTHTIDAKLIDERYVKGWNNTRFAAIAEERYQKSRRKSGVVYTGD